MHKLRHIPIEPLWHLSERSMPTVGVINPFCVVDVASDVICIGGKDEAVIVPWTIKVGMVRLFINSLLSSWRENMPWREAGRVTALYPRIK